MSECKVCGEKDNINSNNLCPWCSPAYEQGKEDGKREMISNNRDILVSIDSLLGLMIHRYSHQSQFIQDNTEELNKIKFWARKLYETCPIAKGGLNESNR